MSELAKQLFDSLKGVKQAVETVAPGLKNFMHETKAELSRLGTHGQMELASALFTGQAFVPYGPGQYTPSRNELHQETEPHHEQQKQQEAERGMER